MVESPAHVCVPGVKIYNSQGYSSAEAINASYLTVNVKPGVDVTRTRYRYSPQMGLGLRMRMRYGGAEVIQ
jgi:hypothetical protein